MSLYVTAKFAGLVERLRREPVLCLGAVAALGYFFGLDVSSVVGELAAAAGVDADAIGAGLEGLVPVLLAFYLRRLVTPAKA